MNLDRVMAVAKKDFAEFRKNRYILMILLIMPLVISFVLPIIYVSAINSVSSQNTNQVDLDITVTSHYGNVSLSNITLAGAMLEHVDITNCVLTSCIVSNSTVTRSIFTAADISNTTLRDSLVYDSRLADIQDNGGNYIRGSSFVGGNTQVDTLKTVMFNLLLLLLMIIPVTIPTVTASYSFVGEKTNRSLEPLLATPISDFELLIGKSASIFLVSISATWLSFAIATGMVDILAKPALGSYPLPNAYWIVGMVLLAPGMCLMSIFANVLISSKVNDVRVSQQVGGVLIMPIILFFILSLTGLLSSGLLPLFIFSGVVFVIDAGILWVSLRVFRREEILVNWK
jgi:ABC-2 type transport system permease protein